MIITQIIGQLLDIWYVEIYYIWVRISVQKWALLLWPVLVLLKISGLNVWVLCSWPLYMQCYQSSHLMQPFPRGVINCKIVTATFIFINGSPTFTGHLPRGCHIGRSSVRAGMLPSVNRETAVITIQLPLGRQSCHSGWEFWIHKNASCHHRLGIVWEQPELTILVIILGIRIILQDNVPKATGPTK